MSRSQKDEATDLLDRMDRSTAVSSNMARAAEMCFSEFEKGAFSQEYLGKTKSVTFFMDDKGLKWPYLYSVMETLQGWAMPYNIPVMESPWSPAAASHQTYIHKVDPQLESRTRRTQPACAITAALIDLRSVVSATEKAAGYMRRCDPKKTAAWAMSIVSSWAEVLQICESMRALTPADVCRSPSPSGCCTAHSVAQSLHEAVTASSAVHSSVPFELRNRGTHDFMVEMRSHGGDWESFSLELSSDLTKDPFSDFRLSSTSLIDSQQRKEHIIRPLADVAAHGLLGPSYDKDPTPNDILNRLHPQSAAVEISGWERCATTHMPHVDTVMDLGSLRDSHDVVDF